MHLRTTYQSNAQAQVHVQTQEKSNQTTKFDLILLSSWLTKWLVCQETKKNKFTLYRDFRFSMPLHSNSQKINNNTNSNNNEIHNKIIPITVHKKTRMLLFRNIRGKQEAGSEQTVIETPAKHLFDDPEASSVIIHDQNLQAHGELIGDHLFTAEEIADSGGRTKDSFTRRCVATPSRAYARLRHSLQSRHDRKLEELLHRNQKP